MRVLVVDDDDLVRVMMVQALRGAGHDVEECSDGSEAISKIKDITYDVVVTDVVMPNQSGASVGEHIKNNKLPTAVLAVSAYSNSDKGDVLDFANYFADDTLEKPFEKEELVQAVNSLVRGTDIDSALENM